jgi:hypothetical protein
MTLDTVSNVALSSLTTKQIIATALGNLGSALNGRIDLRPEDCASKLADTWFADHEVQKYVKEHGLEHLVNTLEQAVTEESIKEARQMVLRWAQVAPRAYRRQKAVIEATAHWPLSAQVESVKQAVREAQHGYTTLITEGLKAVMVSTQE